MLLEAYFEFFNSGSMFSLKNVWLSNHAKPDFADHKDIQFSYLTFLPLRKNSIYLEEFKFFLKFFYNTSLNTEHIRFLPYMLWQVVPSWLTRPIVLEDKEE